MIKAYFATLSKYEKTNVYERVMPNFRQISILSILYINLTTRRKLNNVKLFHKLYIYTVQRKLL